MKKIFLLVLITILFIPYKVYGLDASLELTCDTPGIYQDRVTHCTLSGHTDEIITGVDFVITFDEELELGSFSLSNSFDPMFSVGTVNSGDKILTVANADGDLDVYGDFDILTFNVTMDEEATSSSQSITLSTITFIDSSFTKVYLDDDEEIEFSDFLTMNAYHVEDTKLIIYGLAPTTVGTFKSGVASNAVISVRDKQDSAVADASALATGQTFRVSFRDHTVNYKVSVLGDVLGNGQVTKADAQKIALHVIEGNSIVGDEYLMAADYDGNSSIKMNDAIRLLRSIQN